MRRNFTGTLWIMLAATIALAVVSDSYAQPCVTGLQPGVLPFSPGTDGTVNAMLDWISPGGPPQLIVGGSFSHIGGIAANNIAAWDGVNWRALDNGVDGPVHALTVYNSALIVGGEFLSPGVRLASWNGSDWSALADIGPPTPQPDTAVRALAVFLDQLFVGGRFCCVNGVGVLENCARFDGSLWYGAPGIAKSVRAMQVVDWDGPGPDAPVMYIGGEEWDDDDITLRETSDGTTWTDMDGPTGDVYALTVIDSLGFPFAPFLIVGGKFGGWRLGSEIVSSDNVIKYHTFGPFPMGQGLLGGIGAHVSSLRAYGSDLYVGGEFIGHSGFASPNIARYLDSTNQWATVGGGVGSPAGVDCVKALRVFDNILMVGGDFDYALDSSGPHLVNNIAQWHGASWRSFNQPRELAAMTVLGSRLVMGGNFSQWTQGPEPAPVVNRTNLMTWNGLHTGGLGGGTNGMVRALASYSTGGPFASSNIVAGGDFTTVYGDGLNPDAPVAANRVAQWSEPQLGFAGWSPMGAGFNNNVYALERFNSETIAGGLFTASGATSIPYLARWTGSPPSWQPIGTLGLNNYVYALKTYTTNFGNDQHLVIGGAFSAATGIGAVSANHILQLTQTTLGGTWVGLGAGFNASVYAIERYGNGLQARTYAAGAFTMPGSTLRRVARFTGSPGAWEPVGAPTGGFNNYVYALKSAGGFLYAAGPFTEVDGVPCNHIARWNGSAWSAVNSGTDDIVNVLAAFQNELIVGGVFERLTAGLVPSPAMARLLQTGIPWIAQQPVSSVLPCGQSAVFAVAVADGYPGATYQWRKNGAPLSDGPAAGGSTISGATTDSLTVADATPLDDGSYDCVLANACGSVTSAAATLTITGTCADLCPADLAPAPNGDNAVNVQDLLAVIAAWGGCPNPVDCPADIAPPGGNDVVNVEDLLGIIGAWGPCP